MICAIAPKKPRFSTMSTSPPKYTIDPLIFPAIKWTLPFFAKNFRSPVKPTKKYNPVRKSS